MVMVRSMFAWKRLSALADLAGNLTNRLGRRPQCEVIGFAAVLSAKR
jgi:hypothetical protein